MRHVNLTAYDDVERLSRFQPETLQKYCSDKLKSCDKHVKLIREITNGKTLRVLEIGSGSGKLLFRLEMDGLLETGVGFEVSQSRCRFAEAFAARFDFGKSQIRCQDFMQAALPEAHFDLVIGIDVVTNLIAPLDSTALESLLRSVYACMKPEGYCVLELMTLEREVELIRRSENNIHRTWKVFPDSDPFEFGLDEMSLDRQGNIIWKKLFIARNGERSHFDNVLMPLSRRRFAEICKQHGFNIEIREQWTAGDDTSDQEYVAILTRGSRDNRISG